MSNITKHFTMNEFARSSTAKKYDIDNSPTNAHWQNIKELCENVLEPIRQEVGKPVHITSGYRSQNLNDKLAELGYYVSPRSQHRKGQAADFIVNGLTIEQLGDIIDNAGIVYDQMISETAKRGDHVSTWVHISYNKDKNRKRRFSMLNGKVVK